MNYADHIYEFLCMRWVHKIYEDIDLCLDLKVA